MKLKDIKNAALAAELVSRGFDAEAEAAAIAVELLNVARTMLEEEDIDCSTACIIEAQELLVV
jgi:hypothetical protein